MNHRTWNAAASLDRESAAARHWVPLPNILTRTETHPPTNQTTHPALRSGPPAAHICTTPRPNCPPRLRPLPRDMAGDASSPSKTTAAGPSSSSTVVAGPQQFSPLSLSKRTSSRHALRDTYNEYAGKQQQQQQQHTTGSPPSTPPPQHHRRTKLKEKGKAPLRAHVSEDKDKNRHSHGLSWSSTTRDSVVDNLLFSLDNLSRPNVHETGDYEDRAIEHATHDRAKYMFPFDNPTSLPSIPKTTRPRGHTYSSSSSSIYTRPEMMGSPTTYDSTPKGRRSESSPSVGLQNGFTAKVRASRHRGTSSLSAESPKIGAGDFSRKASMDVKDGMDQPIVDYGYSTITSSTNIRRNRRSLSMDQINEMFSSQQLSASSMLNRGRPVPSVFSPFDSDPHAAPEPMVAAGPRKQQNPAANGPVYVGQAPSKSNLRKVTTQTDLRAASMPTPSPPIPQDIRNQATDFVRANSMRGKPQIPGQEKPLGSPALQRSNMNSASSVRERPGFFKRVFGSGASARTSASSDNLEYGDLMSTPARNSSSGGTVSRSGTRHSSKEHPANTTSNAPPSLNKKPSSFFRRRKKSASENGPPPPLPLGMAGQQKILTAEPSPSVSSLRKVMDPFLANEKGVSKLNLAETVDDGSRPATQDSTEDTDDLDIFHSGYTPPPDASLGKRNPLTRLSTETEKGKASVDKQRGEDANKMKVKKRKNELLAPLGQTSFLLDASSRERSRTPPPVSPALVSPLPDAMGNDSKENTRPVSRASTGDRIIAARALSPVEGQDNAKTSRENSDDTTGSEFVQQSIDQRPSSKKSERLYIMPTASEEMLGYSSREIATMPRTSKDVPQSASIKSPAYHTATSAAFPADVHSPTTPSTRFHSASSLPLVQIDGNEPRKSHEANGLREVPPVIDEGAEYRERARKIFDGDEEDVTKTEAAPWLGEKNTLSTKTLEAYMQLFDFAGFNILVALRLLCGKLALKGETQQFDRIITALSRRWCECNPNHGFKAQDVVHTICYSLILLNTDLHLADIGEKMSRSAYVKNTLPTIRRVAADAAPTTFDETLKAKPNATRPTLPWSDSNNSVNPASPSERTSFENDRPLQMKRLSIRPAFDRHDSDGWTPDSTGGNTGPANALNALVNQPSTSTIRGWEFEIENILKSFYASIRSDPLPLHGGPTAGPGGEMTLAERNLSVQNFTPMLKRTGSVVSKAPSDNMSYRSKAGLRSMTLGFQNKYTRSRPKLYPPSNYGSSGTSFGDADSVWSPVGSSSWSKYSASKTLTSASMQSLGTVFSSHAGEFKHSIGFANALSQAIIREENQGAVTGDNDSTSMSVPGELLEDESLALEGAPWAKEGLVQHKHHLEASGRKAKERTWNNVFAVIGKGTLTLFAFNTSSKSQSLGRRGFSKFQANGRAGSAAGQRVGGGDWMENAEQLNVFFLRQTIASVLPPPGYSKTRPHVWALSLPTGAVHLFQVGTPEIAQEFMTTANYWSARLSKEPLSGGVSNIEYGWSENVINPALIERAALPDRPGTTSPPPAVSSPSYPPGAMSNGRGVAHHGHTHTSSTGGGSVAMPRPSFQSSLRGSFDTGFGTTRGRLPGDKVSLAEWTPPVQSMMASQLMEVDQLKALNAYVASVERELAGHNELKGAIELAVFPSPITFPVFLGIGNLFY